MQGNKDILRKELVRLLPSSILCDIACFVFYDNHPRDPRTIDITICTKSGELKEYYKRDVMGHNNLKIISVPTEIIIHRNSKSNLFYIVGFKNEIQLVSYKDNALILHRIITNVDKYTVDDISCNGQAFLKIIKKDDAVPINFDDDLISNVLFPEKTKPGSLPLITELKRKYIEAKHSINDHEKTIKEYCQLRHAATVSAYMNIQPNLEDSLYYSKSEVSGALNVKAMKSWIKVCNKKLIFALRVQNDYKETVSEVHIVLQSSTIMALAHYTKVFDKTDTLPFWKERDHNIPPNSEATVLAVINLDEIQPNVTDGITIKGALSYQESGNAHLLPFEKVKISMLETFGDAFDALFSSECDALTMLAILSTTVKTDLIARLVKPLGANMINLLIKHLGMEKVGPDVLLYKKSPYHLLNGVMLHFTGGTDKRVSLTAYTRTKSQLMAFIHGINDAVPAYIIITPSYMIISRVEDIELIPFIEQRPNIPNTDHLGYAKTITARTAKILQYLNWCMMKMNESKDPNVRAQIGLKIDLYGCGKNAYKEFRDKMIREEKKGVDCLLREVKRKDEPMVED